VKAILKAAVLLPICIAGFLWIGAILLIINVLEYLFRLGGIIE
jgi:hypothetical protein